ncbi:MAG: HPr family phosphocarrier protein [Pseudobutyrivibrio sp.]|nr:HPr family phosphocarrier protein [Pseudobutyrivibrio sp.]
MVKANVKVMGAAGFNLRPAGILCEEAMKFPCKITFWVRGTYEANAKSVLSVLGACVKAGEEIELICEGEREQEALDHLVQAIESGLGE